MQSKGKGKVVPERPAVTKICSLIPNFTQKIDKYIIPKESPTRQN
jgi:hypothetical protein